MSKKYSIASARDQLARLVHHAESGSAVELTRRGKPVAVILAIEDYQRLQNRPASFAAALTKLRSEINFEDVGVESEEWLEPRDPSPGRSVPF